jgi:hypothetical protein
MLGLLIFSLCCIFIAGVLMGFLLSRHWLWKEAIDYFNILVITRSPCILKKGRPE